MAYASFRVSISVCVCIAAAISMAAMVIFWVRRRRKKVAYHQKQSDCESPIVYPFPASFTYDELRIATDNFSHSHLIGKGASGAVYKGVLPADKSTVAVKRLSAGFSQIRNLFLAELSIIGKLRHRNLVTLKGWCRENGKLLLVYEYMSNGSLKFQLFETETCVLGWPERLRILKGVACALVYLHEGWEQQVLHRDVKAGNVLLDENLTAKLADFGLATLLRHSRRGEEVQGVAAGAGTPGYMAPEMMQAGKATAKSDVYAFGVLCLEVACGKAAVIRSDGEEEIGLVEWVWKTILENHRIVDVADPRLDEEFEEEEMERVVNIGLVCTNVDEQKRPFMRHVHSMLQQEMEAPSLQRNITPWW